MYPTNKKRGFAMYSILMTRTCVRDLDHRRPIGPLENTIEAGLAAAFAAAITNPLDAAKSKTQATLLPKVRGHITSQQSHWFSSSLYALYALYAYYALHAMYALYA